MPKTTHKFPFEYHIRELVERLLALSREENGNRTGSVLIQLTASGRIQQIQFDHRPTASASSLDHPKVKGQPYIWYDRFDPPEYAWLEWFEVSRPTMERIVGRDFEAFDFQPQFSSSTDHAPTAEFPTTWGVMF